MEVSRQTVVIILSTAVLAAAFASATTLAVDRIVFHDDAAAELRREYAQRQSDEAAASKWMTEPHASDSSRRLFR